MSLKSEPDDRFALSPSRFAMYFFHDCERYLRYSSTPKVLRHCEGVPSVSKKESPVTRAILEGGYDWEERVVKKLLRKRVIVPKSKKPLRERFFTPEKSLEVLSKLKPGQSVYQTTLVPPHVFLDRYDLDPDVVEFRPCRPDILTAVETDDGLALRVIDIKASDMLKASHRIQICLYALMLRDIVEDAGLDIGVDTVTGGVWLYERSEPDWFELGTTLNSLEGFLHDDLLSIFECPVEEATWHLHYRCEWCHYFDHCREEAETTESVSLIPYMTVGGRRFLHEAPWPKGKPVETLSDFDSFLARKDADECLSTCGSLKGRSQRLKTEVKAITESDVVPHGGSSIAFPIREQVRLVMTLQSDPLSGEIYVAAFRRFMGKDVYGSTFREEIFVADSPDKCDLLRHQFIEALFDELQTLHDYNSEREWADQKGLQCYVFDNYELRLLNDVLFAALEQPATALAAMQLLFFFQSERLAAVEEHPDGEVPFSVIALAKVIRSLVALPIPLVIRLPEALKSLPAPSFDFSYDASSLFCFELSNALKSDAIFQAWNDGKKKAVKWVRDEVKRRLIATNALVDGLRDKISGRLFAWPPKFQLPFAQDFVHSELSQLAFVVRYESLMGALNCRSQRVRPWNERIREAISIPLRYQGKHRWKPLIELDETAIEESGFFHHILVPAGEEGERAQMAYDDYRHRQTMWAPKGLIRLASIDTVTPSVDTGIVKSIHLGLKENKQQREEGLKKGYRAVLHPRFTDFTSKRVLDRLAVLDTIPDNDFLNLLRDPVEFSKEVQAPKGVAVKALTLGRKAKLAPSQLAALRQFISRKLTLIWGPPGTGKTYFLAKAILALIGAREKHGQILRVAVTAFTHAAVENLLRELQDAMAETKGPCCELVKIGRTKTPRGETLETLDEKVAASVFGDQSIIIGGTVYAFRKIVDWGFEPCDVLVIDEGSQLKLGETALAMMALAPRGRLIIAGDDLQLPPIISGEYPKPEDGLPGLQDSIFSYLRARDDASQPYTMQLLENWRMNKTLSRFPAESLYSEEYKPATKAIATQRLSFKPAKKIAHINDEIAEWLLEPDFPLSIGVLEDVRATAENRAEAELVAHLSVTLRNRLLKNGKIFRNTEAGDSEFWRKGLFIVSPHHIQIRAIRTALSNKRAWKSPPFVDTVDKMQGQQCEAVIVSYGVSDVETALAEATFIYSLNRLNVSITRARKKCIVFLPRPLLSPSFDVLANEEATKGLGFMHKMISFCRNLGEERQVELENAGRLTLIRCSMN